MTKHPADLELLEAAKNITKWMAVALNERAFDGCVLPHGAQHAQNRLRAAIAKAEGAE